MLILHQLSITATPKGQTTSESYQTQELNDKKEKKGITKSTTEININDRPQYLLIIILNTQQKLKLTMTFLGMSQDKKTLILALHWCFVDSPFDGSAKTPHHT